MPQVILVITLAFFIWGFPWPDQPGLQAEVICLGTAVQPLRVLLQGRYSPSPSPQISSKVLQTPDSRGQGTRLRTKLSLMPRYFKSTRNYMWSTGSLCLFNYAMCLFACGALTLTATLRKLIDLLESRFSISSKLPVSIRSLQSSAPYAGCSHR